MGKAWVEKLEPFLLSKACNNIYARLKKDAKNNDIFPINTDLFKAFKLVEPDKVNLILMGMEPYYDKYVTTGKPQADGLAFSNSYGTIQPSLEVLLRGISYEEDLDYKEYYETNDLTYLTKQGVLLFNKSLTVINKQIDSHNGLWNPLWEYFFKNIYNSKIPILTYGKKADEIKNYLKKTDLYWNLLHPNFYVRKKESMDTKGVYKQINNYLRKEKNIAIKWSYKSWKSWNKIDWLDSTLSPF